MKTFELNGEEYKAKGFDFNLICDLEDMGVSIQDMSGKTMSMIRGYVGICAGITKEEAGKEINQHMIKGGKLDSVMDCITEEMNKSDFFQALSQREKAEATESEK